MTKIVGLAKPPWAKGAPARVARVVAGLEVQARPERVRKGGTLEYAYDYKTFAPGGSRALDRAGQKRMVATIAANVASGTPLQTSDICWLPHDEGLALWNRADVKFRFDTFSLRVITAVFGEASLDSTFARIARGEVVDPNPGPNFTSISTTLDGICQVDSTRVAPIMVRAYFDEKKSSDAWRVAEDWFLRMPETTAVALVPVAVGAQGAARDEAEAVLRMLALRKHDAKIRKVAKSYGAAAATAVDELIAARAPKKMKPPKLPAYLDPKKLPCIDGLDLEETANLLRYAMAWAPELVEEDEAATEQNPYGREASDDDADDPLDIEQAFKVHVANWHPVVLEAKASLDARQLRAFGVALYETWLAAGAKDKWVLFASALFGGDDVARLLGPQIRKWKADKQTARAQLALDALLFVETDFALGMLDGLAHRAELKTLAVEAGFRVRRLARARGLSRDELDDRLVPDLGLDASSSRVLASGARVVLGEDLALRVDGRADDELESLRDAVREIAPLQTRRLEGALVMRKRWAPAVFEKFVVAHPIVGLIARRLVFGAYDDRSALVATFRVAEDRTLADAGDRAFELGARRVGIVERKATSLTRVKGRRVPPGALIALERTGWTRERDARHRSVLNAYALWVGTSLDAHVSFTPGIELRKLGAAGEQTLGEIVLRRIDGVLVTNERAPFGELDAVVFSEIVRALSIGAERA